MKKICELLLSALLVTCMTGCNNGNESNSNNEENSDMQTNITFTGDNINFNEEKTVKGEIHQFNQQETDRYLVSNGFTEYKILIPFQSSSNLIVYVKDFVSLFFEATGITLNIVSDNEVNPSSNDYYISIGDNKLFQNENISLDYNQLKSQGYIIKTINNTIFMNGFSDDACLYAMYELLNLSLDYDFYGPNSYYIKTKVKNIPLMNYDVINAPDIEYRMPSYNFSNASILRKYQLTCEDQFMQVGKNRWHNTFDYLPPEQYMETHPEWYSDDKSQLCYTAHGNEESLNEMISIVTEEIEQCMIDNPTKTCITFTIQDINSFCTCEKCTESKLKYNGANSAVVIKFLNRVSDNLNEWLKSDSGKKYDRDLKILFFAYLETNAAPAVFDEKKQEYVPIDDSVICNDNVNVFFADIRGDYTRSYYDLNSANAVFINNMLAWKAISKKFFFWMYSTNFRYYLTPYNSFNAIQDTYKFAKECNTTYLFDQGQHNQGAASTGWSFLKQYISSKLLWDVNLNQEKLIDDFFKYFYSQEASKIMRELFDEYRVLANYQCDVLGYKGELSIYHETLKKEYWPKNTLLKWLEMFDKALDTIEYLKTENPGEYTNYYNHITAERVAYVYLLLKIYGASLSESDLKMYKKMFHEDAENNGMIYESENGSLITNILN